MPTEEQIAAVARVSELVLGEMDWRSKGETPNHRFDPVIDALLDACDDLADLLESS